MNRILPRTRAAAKSHCSVRSCCLLCIFVKTDSPANPSSTLVAEQVTETAFTTAEKQWVSRYITARLERDA